MEVAPPGDVFPQGCGEEMLIYGVVFVYCWVFYWMSAASFPPPSRPPEIYDLFAISAAQIEMGLEPRLTTNSHTPLQYRCETVKPVQINRCRTSQ